MEKAKKTINAVDEYISRQPKEVQAVLKTMRRTIRGVAPKAKEAMGYGVPAFFLNGPLVYYAAFKKHVGLYPTSSGIKAFKKELSAYKTSAGTVQFPLDQPVPWALVKRIVKFRVGENNKGKKC
ncbi:MAG: DUF1801 domain-containing protein [candidate division FCPU426 bacterium]